MFVFVQTMGESYQAIFLFYSFIGAIIFVVMSALAGAALRSTKSQVKQHTRKKNITNGAELHMCHLL